MNADTNSLDSLDFEIQNNKIVARLKQKQMNFCFVARKNDKEMTERYSPIISRPEASIEVRVLDLPWKEAPEPGEAYEILGSAQDSNTQKWGQWSIQEWIAPGKSVLVPRIKNPPTPATAQPPAPVRAPAATANPDPTIISDIKERIGEIETDLENILETFRIKSKSIPPKKYLIGAEKTLKDMLEAMTEIAEQIREGKISHPLDYTPLSERLKVCRENALKASGLLRKAQDALLAKSARVPTPPAPTKVPTPAPTTPPTIDLAPVNSRVDALEQQLKDLAEDIADKASTDDFTDLSVLVDGLTNQVTDMDTKVGSLKGEVNGLNTKVGDLDKTCTVGFTSLQGAIAGITAQIAKAAAATSATPLAPTTGTAPAANAAPAATTAPATPANVTRAAAPTTNGGGKWFSTKNAFLAFIFGITVISVLGIIFSAPRPQQTTPVIVVPTSQSNTPPTPATVTTTTPPPAPLPKMSEEELEKKRSEIRAQQELVLGTHPNLMVRHTNTKPEEGGVVNINGNGNVVGKNVTINNNYQDRKTDSNVDGTHQPSVFNTSQRELGPRLVYTPRIWNPTGTLGTVETENPFGENTGYTRDYY